ncbi:hypothetical protein WOLCODRAFT_163907 [Wolfiporia cocos MD-104 SS10]|uniref:Uncharacterized protein n=1 Tax=Wolfiporia cocos (strain MD-104) TaxID=742152 RepID=A0A2H3JK77_WOLCO|nr:hypothetical protein WOLCODRAFT_163907 [Wolfiporia cocos MD-104 SS10]
MASVVAVAEAAGGTDTQEMDEPPGGRAIHPVRFAHTHARAREWCAREATKAAGGTRGDYKASRGKVEEKTAWRAGERREKERPLARLHKGP